MLFHRLLTGLALLEYYSLRLFTIGIDLAVAADTDQSGLIRFLRIASKYWPSQQLANDSGRMSRVADVDSDGFIDLIVVNGKNGVTSELNSYVYWDGPDGLAKSN